MRLLFLEWDLSSRLGGMELCMYEECVQLRHQGHEVHLGYHRPGDLSPLYEQAGVRLIRMAHYAPLRRRLLRDTAGIMGNLRRTVSIPLDAVVANAYQSTFFGALLAKAKGIPLLCHLRLNPPERPTAPTRLGLRSVDRFIAESTAVRDAWMETGVAPARIDVVHDGIDVQRFRPLARERLRDALGLTTEDFVILVAGRIDPVKNLEGVLRTFARVRLQLPRARLLVAGTPVSHDSPDAGWRYLQSLQALARNLGLADDVLWLGHRSDMPELYNAADVVTLFGLIPEPFGRVTCEALACGRPMVTACQGGSTDILTGEFARLMFVPGDEPQAARIICSLAGWQHHDPGFASRAREHVLRNFDLQGMGQRMAGALARAADTAHGGRIARKRPEPREVALARPRR